MSDADFRLPESWVVAQDVWEKLEAILPHDTPQELRQLLDSECRRRVEDVLQGARFGRVTISGKDAADFAREGFRFLLDQLVALRTATALSVALLQLELTCTRYHLGLDGSHSEEPPSSP